MAGNLITDDWQIEWRGLLLGSGTPYGWQNLTGWIQELPEIRLDTQPRPHRHGSYSGQLLAGDRIVTYEFVLHAAYGSFVEAVDALRVATALDEDPVEEPLTVRLSGATWQANARCTRRALPVGRRYRAQATAGAIQWVATDPLCYSPTELSATAGLQQPASGGLVFPLTFPLTFGSGSVGGELTAENTGMVTTWPQWHITGPVTGPTLTNVDTGMQLAFDPAFTVDAGQVLVIDTDVRTVTLSGANRRNKLLTAEWFGFPKGVTRVRFAGTGPFDAAASATVFWRHATI